MDTISGETRSRRAVALGVALVAGVVYVKTLLPGVAFGDWAEMQVVPYLMGIAHPTGYPLAVLVGKLWSLLPIGSIAYRANLLVAVEAAAAVGCLVLVLARLRVRPLVAAPVALLLAAIPTVWTAGTTARVDALHMLFVTLLLHRALIWSDERRPRDFLILAVLSGLAVSNHMLTITVAPFIALFAVWSGRRELLHRPLLLVGGVLAGVAGLLPYLYIPIRASIGPAFAYGDLLTPQGFWYLVSGAMFRGNMGFLRVEGVSSLLAQGPALINLAAQRWGPLAMAWGVLGFLVLIGRRTSVAVLLLVLVFVNLFFYVNYYGNLEHYLILTWIAIAIGTAVGLEATVSLVERLARPAPRFLTRVPSVAGSRIASAVAGGLAVIVAVSFGLGWQASDLSGDHRGDAFTTAVFAALPQNAALYTYWDALEPLQYAQCVEGLRPDLLILTYPGPRTTMGCAGQTAEPADLAKTRDVYGLFMFDGDVQAAAQGMAISEVAKVLVAYGRPYPEHSRWIYRFTPAP